MSDKELSNEELKVELKDFLKTLQEDYESADKTVAEFKKQLRDPYLDKNLQKQLREGVQEVLQFQTSTYNSAVKVQKMLDEANKRTGNNI